MTLNIDDVSLEMVGILYEDKNYEEALKGLKLIRAGMTLERFDRHNEGLKKIDSLIRICKLRIKQKK